jgi:hypothetical protein
LYIHDTLELFGADLTTLNAFWKTLILPELSKKDVRGLRESADQYFSAVTDIIRDAARMPAGRQLSPERLQQLCQAALAEIFAE